MDEPEPRRRGHRQRAADLQNRVVSTVSGLASWLLEQWAFGIMAATMLQRIAKFTVGDHEHSPQPLVHLAGLGTGGVNPQHCHEELKRYVSDEPGLPEAMTVKVPMKSLKRKDGEQIEVDADLSFHAPHLVFEALYKNFPASFFRRFTGPGSQDDPEAANRAFWASVLDDDPRKQAILDVALRRDGVVDEHVLWGKTCAIDIHGDEVPINKMKLDVTSWSGTQSAGLSTIDSKILIVGLLNRCMAGRTTMVAWNVILWSLLALQSGLHPRFDWEGTPWPAGSHEAAVAGSYLAAGFCAVIWLIKGDMDWIANSLGLEHYGAKLPCPWCRCNTVQDANEEWAMFWNEIPKPWNDWGDDAAWQRTIWTNVAEWISQHGGLRNMHALFSLPGVSIFNVMPDPMHVVDLGFVHHVLGNVIFWLCYSGEYPLFGAGRPATRLDALWLRIVPRYPPHTSQLGNLTLSMFCDEKAPYEHFPQFTSNLKATITRHLVPVLALVFEDLIPRAPGGEPTNANDTTILQLLQSLANYYTILGCKEYALPRRDQRRFARSIWNMLRLYSRMSEWAISQRPVRMMWNEVPKFHYLAHIALLSVLANPRMHWCYMDEDFMKLMKAIAEKCTSGTPSHMVFTKIAGKWGFGVSHRMNRGLGV